MISAAIHKEARRLAALSLEAGAVSPERVHAVLVALEKTRKPARLRPLLKAYYTALRREIARSQARIEHAGNLPAETIAQITAHFTQRYGRSLTPLPQENPALLLGVRVRVGDDVYDASAKGSLDRLAASLT